VPASFLMAGRGCELIGSSRWWRSSQVSFLSSGWVGDGRIRSSRWCGSSRASFGRPGGWGIGGSGPAGRRGHRGSPCPRGRVVGCAAIRSSRWCGSSRVSFLSSGWVRDGLIRSSQSSRSSRVSFQSLERVGIGGSGPAGRRGHRGSPCPRGWVIGCGAIRSSRWWRSWRGLPPAGTQLAPDRADMIQKSGGAVT
jgi:hypothetical protein